MEERELMRRAFCSMCGPKFCSMNHSVKIQEFTAADAEAVLTPLARCCRLVVSEHDRVLFLPPPRTDLFALAPPG
jgi:hypothetical protein